MLFRSILWLVLLALSFPQDLFAYTTVECLNCHKKGGQGASKQIAEKDFFNSTHGQNLSCQDCHTGIIDQNHQEIEGLGNVTCSDCHDQEIKPTNYWSWFSSFRVAFHGKQDFSQVYQKSDCLGCHQGQGAHGEKEPLDAQTCYKCHREIGKRAAILGYIHPGGDLNTYPIVFASVVLDQAILILFGIGGITFLLNRFRKGR